MVKRPFRVIALQFLVVFAAGIVFAAQSAPQPPGPYSQWSNGPGKDASYFPIAVWLQNPNKAAEYRKAGINLYIGLWKGPTGDQLRELTKAGMPVICSQNSVGLAHKDDPIIVGWMHPDEPDNAQSLGKGKGYGPPVAPAEIVSKYEEMRKADPSRPVLLNLGQGVAFDGWIGRGTRTNHPEDYAEYVKGCDIASFDIYPVASSTKAVKGNLDFVARGAERLVEWAGDRPAWTCIECTNIDGTGKATPRQIRAEVWMALVHGSKGLIYFVHEFKPKFNEHALLNDPETLAAVTAINAEIHTLAPALNSPAIDGGVTMDSTDAVAVSATARRVDGATYVFAVAEKPSAGEAAFVVKGLTGKARLEVIGEGRSLEAVDGVFRDTFRDWDVHLYKIDETGDRSPETGGRAR